MASARSANQFISALVKNLQAVCHGHVEFDQNVKVVGHLYLTVDSATEFNYIVNEKVSKSDESSTTFISKSFYATDPQQQNTPNRNVNRPFSQRSPPTHVLGQTRYDFNVDLSQPSSSLKGYSRTQARYKIQQSKPRLLGPKSKRRQQTQIGNHNEKYLKLSAVSDDLDLDADLPVTFASAEPCEENEPKLETESRVPPLHPTEQDETLNDDNISKSPDVECAGELSSALNESIDSTSITSTPITSTPVASAPFKISPDKEMEMSNNELDVDLSKVKEEKPDGDTSYFDSSGHLKTEEDNTLSEDIKDESELYSSSQHSSFYSGYDPNDSNTVPNLPGMSNQGAGYLSTSFSGTDMDLSNNAGMDDLMSLQRSQQSLTGINMTNTTNTRVPHPKAMEYKCDNCQVPFFLKNSLLNHTCFSTSGIALPSSPSAPHAKKVTKKTTKKTCRKNIDSRPREMSYKCELCDTSFYYKNSLLNHKCKGS